MSSPPIVVDCGSAVTRIGFGGESEPTSIIQSVFSRPRRATRDEVIGPEDVLAGSSVLGVKHPESVIRYPVENRVFANWEDVDLFFRYLFLSELDIKIENHPLLLTVAPQTSKKQREDILQAVFETYRVPYFYGASPSAMSLYAAGINSGIVIDSGDRGTSIMPVFECYSMPYVAKNMKIGGRYINDVLRKALIQSGYHCSPGTEQSWIGDMKEAVCYVAQDPSSENNLSEAKFLAPDGIEVKIGTECFMGPEALFKPSLVGLDEPGIAEFVAEVVSRLDEETRTTLCKSILLAGGSTMFNGYVERLTTELKNLIPDVELRVLAPSGRKISAWVGGSIISSVRTFKDLWVSKAEYEEVGPSIFGVKCY